MPPMEHEISFHNSDDEQLCPPGSNISANLSASVATLAVPVADTLARTVHDVQKQARTKGHFAEGMQVFVKSLPSPSNAHLTGMKGECEQFDMKKKKWHVYIEDLDTSLMLSPSKLSPEIIDVHSLLSEDSWRYRRCQASNTSVFGRYLLTMTAAKDVCRATLECVGFSAKIPAFLNPQEEHMFSFMTASTCEASDDWLTIQVRHDPGSDDEVWHPPVPNRWVQNPRVRYVSESPVLLEIDGFLSHAEADYAISIMQNTPLKKKGRLDPAVGLFSTHDPLELVLRKRIEEFVGVPTTNIEPMSVLKYTKGERHKLHIDHHKPYSEQACGVRLGSVLIYLNDVVEGGETYFPQLGVEVKPVRGRALIYWNFDLHKLRGRATLENLLPDDRTEHGSYAVRRGAKWAIITGLHIGEFMTFFERGLVER